MTEKLKAKFTDTFQTLPRIIRAPGRVNLIGEHTDYNNGFVLPAALTLSTFTAFSRRTDNRLLVHSLAMNETKEFDLNEVIIPKGDWTDYVLGIVKTLHKEGITFTGANLMIESDIPLGSGLSSSAALLVSVCLSLIALAEVKKSLTPLMTAQICQRAENEFVGTKSGIMDQLISCLGKKGTALFIDCGLLKTEYVPLPKDAFTFIMVNSMVRHELAASEYNQRRAECEQGLAYFQEKNTGIKDLRDVTEADLNLEEARLDNTIFRRLRHVITENKRVLAAVTCLKKGDLKTLGQLMSSSHLSLKNDYEVSCPELDLLVELAGNLPGLIGARMTGGGFGGSTVNLVENNEVEKFSREMKKGFIKETGIEPEIIISESADGAREIV